MNCPHCGDPMRTGVDGRALLWACVPCQYITNRTVGDALPEATKETALKLPLDPGPAQKRVKEAEKQLVQRIRLALQRRGYVVQRVGQRRADLAGTDAGVADLLIRNPAWPPTLTQQQEVKLPGEPVPDHQQILADAGVTVIVRSVEQSLAAVQELDCLFSQKRP